MARKRPQLATQTTPQESDMATMTKKTNDSPIKEGATIAFTVELVPYDGNEENMRPIFTVVAPDTPGALVGVVRRASGGSVGVSVERIVEEGAYVASGDETVKLPDTIEVHQIRLPLEAALVGHTPASEQQNGSNQPAQGVGFIGSGAEGGAEGEKRAEE